MKKMALKTKAESRKKVSVASGMDTDFWFVFASVALLVIGLVMVGSSSISIADRQLGQPFYYLIRQVIYVGLGLLLAYAVLHIPVEFWKRSGGSLLLLGIVSLFLLMIPGVGKEVNGSARWISIGVANIQPSEFIKFFVVIYLAGYLVRRGEEVRTAFKGFVKPMLILALICALLLAEPDFGAAAVMMVTAMGMMFLGGVKFWQFCMLTASVGALLALLAISSPYRLERITAFMDPWADPFASGFQLTQALIAFGRGEWLGAGLGSSVQKLFYLPEAHTDFLFAVLAEELGLVGSLFVLGLFVLLIVRAFKIGRRAEYAGRQFDSFVAYGCGMWVGLQAVINIGVNMGLLPTKGLTLPLMSYGGSSILVMCIVVALLLRIDYETRNPDINFSSGRVRW
ncbi:MAG: putative lipid II flippase FtsW [Gammaproteobacteria bacterium]